MPQQFKDKDGNVIDIKGVDENTINVVGLIIEGQMAGVRTAITEQVSSAVGQAVGKVVEEQIKPLADQVAKVKPAEKTPGQPGDDANKSEIQKAIEAAVAPVLETVNSLKQEREGEKAAQTSRQLAQSYVENHRPNLRGKDRLVARIAGAGVKGEEDCQKVVAEWEAEMKDLLGDDGFSKLSADAEGEGAKDTPKGSEAEAEKAKADRIKDIKQRGAA